MASVVGSYTVTGVAQRFDPDFVGEGAIFEIDAQVAHPFKHPHLGVDDIYDVGASEPLFYPAKRWLMCPEVTRSGSCGPAGPFCQQVSETSVSVDRSAITRPARADYPLPEE